MKHGTKTTVTQEEGKLGRFSVLQVKLKAGRSGQREKVPEASGPLLPPVDKRPSQDEANRRHQSDLPAGRGLQQEGAQVVAGVHVVTWLGP